MRDAILTKLMKMEKREHLKKTALMSHRFKTRLATQRMIPMLDSSSLAPYKIKYKKTLPLFKIDKENFSLYRNEALSESKLEQIINQMEQ